MAFRCACCSQTTNVDLIPAGVGTAAAIYTAHSRLVGYSMWGLLHKLLLAVLRMKPVAGCAHLG
jgi:hypothetical protein